MGMIEEEGATKLPLLWVSSFLLFFLFLVFLFLYFLLHNLLLLFLFFFLPSLLCIFNPLEIGYLILTNLFVVILCLILTRWLTSKPQQHIPISPASWLKVKTATPAFYAHSGGSTLGSQVQAVSTVPHLAISHPCTYCCLPVIIQANLRFTESILSLPTF